MRASSVIALILMATVPAFAQNPLPPVPAPPASRQIQPSCDQIKKQPQPRAACFERENKALKLELAEETREKTAAQRELYVLKVTNRANIENLEKQNKLAQKQIDLLEKQHQLESKDMEKGLVRSNWLDNTNGENPNSLP